ncbi:MAG: HNH endonuclease [Muribaculaceae bacterium]|nr:HNH endonuclease [Muribaculaceae bacterium]
MKILPLLNYNIYTTPSANIKKNEKPLLSTQPMADTFLLSFKGEKSYIEQAMETSGIHCPICGKAMLNEKELSKIVERAANVQTVEDFTKILHEYKDYIPESMKDILKGSSENSNNLNLDFTDYFAKLSKSAFLRHKRHVEASNNYLIEYSITQSEEIQNKLFETLKTLPLAVSHVSYKQKLLPIIKSFKTASKQEYLDILNKTILGLEDSSNHLFVFKIPDYKEKTAGELAQIMVSRIFSKSLMESGKISRTWDTENPNNEIITCKSCSIGEHGKTFLSPTDLTRPDFKENIRKYLQDISVVMGQKNHLTNAPYIVYLSRFIDRISQHNITFSPDEIIAMKKLNHMASRHSEFTPLTQSKTDIPCAGCGSTMLPHETKKQIETELKARSTIQGYIGVLKKYDKYIGVYAKPAADIIFELEKSSAGMSIREFVENVQKEMDNVSAQKINGIMTEFNRLRPAIQRNNTAQEAENYDKVIEILKEITNREKFKQDFNYKDMAIELTDRINLSEDMPVGVYTLLNKIRIACFENSLVKTNEFDRLKDKDELYSILFKIFTSDIGTTDHFIAMIKGGEKDIHNMIGLCKTCNTVVKGDRKVYTWFVQNPSVRDNFLKHLIAIDAMARRGEIEGFDDWAETISEKMFDLTYNKYDIRDYFKEPK